MQATLTHAPVVQAEAAVTPKRPTLDALLAGFRYYAIFHSPSIARALPTNEDAATSI